MDRGAWRATVHGVTKDWIRLGAAEYLDVERWKVGALCPRTLTWTPECCSASGTHVWNGEQQ